MQLVCSVLLMAALAAGASISDQTNPENAPDRQKRGLFGGYYEPSHLTSAVVAHAPVAPVYSAPIVAPAPVYHAPLVAHAPASTSYSSVSITHTVPKVAIAHAPVAVAHAPVYQAPVYAAHAPVFTGHGPLFSHAPAYYH